MIRVLLDTNVVLDALLDRQPWNVQARAIWQAHLDVGSSRAMGGPSGNGQSARQYFPGLSR